MLRVIDRLRRCRAAVVMAAAVIAAQAFLTGLTLAQTAIGLEPGLADLTVICHGGGGADAGTGTAPDPIKAGHPCCLACTAGAPPAVLTGPPIMVRVAYQRSFELPAASNDPILIAARAIRAGLSQAPPSHA
jgi:hypothetical protein